MVYFPIHQIAYCYVFCTVLTYFLQIRSMQIYILLVFEATTLLKRRTLQGLTEFDIGCRISAEMTQKKMELFACRLLRILL